MRPLAVRAGRVVAGFVVGLVVCACAGAVRPGSGALVGTRWSGDGACLSVGSDVCDLVAGCGHGQFPVPVVRADGTFDVQGTYRIEAGPVGIDPAPPATFSGTVTGNTMTVTVTPSDPSLRPASYSLHLTGGFARCTVPCV